MLIVLKSGSLNLLEPSGPVQACNEIAFTVLHCNFLEHYLTFDSSFTIHDPVVNGTSFLHTLQDHMTNLVVVEKGSKYAEMMQLQRVCCLYCFVNMS